MYCFIVFLILTSSLIGVSAQNNEKFECGERINYEGNLKSAQTDETFSKLMKVKLMHDVK